MLHSFAIAVALSFMVARSVAEPHAVSSPVTVDQAQGDVVTIDGSKNPELIPQWFRWELAFRNFLGVSQRSRAEFQTLLGFSAAEQEVLLGELKRFEELSAATSKRLKAARQNATARGLKEEQIRAETHVVDLDYRTKILEGQQRLFDQVPEGRLVLLKRYLDNLIKGTTVRLSGESRKYFYQPR